jgi:hypothetical protein
VIYRNVYKKAIEAPNNVNLIGTTNYTIPKMQGRRLIPLDIALHRKGNKDYFKNIANKCFNLQVGEAFFSYLLTEITDEEVDNYDCQKDFPDTENKLIAISNALHSVHKFIKFDYILRQKSITKILTTELYNFYKFYCSKEKVRECGKNDFYQKLEEIKILKKKINGREYYNISYEDLKAIADKEKWICKYDEFETDIFDDDEEKKKSLLDAGIDEPDYKKITQEQNKKIEELEKQIKLLQSRDVFKLLKDEIDKMNEHSKKLLSQHKKNNIQDTSIFF